MGNRPHNRRVLAAPTQPPTIIPGLGVDLPELRQARALWSLNRFDEALALFEQAVRKHPQNLVALTDASRALGARFEIRRAEAMLERLLQVAARRPDLLLLAGQSYRMIFRPERAIECFERALRQAKNLPDLYLELAVLYERRHRVGEAASLIDECLRRAPDYLEALLFKARLLRRLNEATASETTFRDLTRNEKAHPLVRVQAWAELAQMHDRQEQYPQAMAAMLQCKTILLEREGGILAAAEPVLRHLVELAQGLTTDHFQRWHEGAIGSDARRVAVLTGFPRSGTTLLEQILDSHSDAVSSDEREAFARDIFPAIWLTPSTPTPTPEALDAAPPQRLRALRDRYLSYLEAALNEPMGTRLHLDKNPTLTVVLPGFLRLFPETRLLIALRDPRDVVISCFMQYLPLNSNSVYFLTLERTAERYANDLRLWLTLRDKLASPWLEVRYEDTVEDLETQARRVLEFLGLAWESGVLEYRQRLRDKAVASPTYEAVAQPLYRRAIGRWQHYEEFLKPCLPTLQPLVDAFGY